MKRKIKFINTNEKDHETVQIDNITVHSKRYPYKSSSKFFDFNKKILTSNSNIVIYGFGLGYHINYILNNLEGKYKIYVFDFDEELMKYSKTKKIYSKLKENHKVKLFLGNISKNYIEFKNKVNENIIFYEPSLESLKTYNKKLYESLRGFVIAKNSKNKFSPQIEKNNQINIKRFKQSKFLIDNYFKKYKMNDKPILIASGGPSLENAIKFIKANRNKFYLFSLGRSLDFLLKNTIIPDNIIIIDPQNIVYEQIKKYCFLNIPLLFLSSSNKKAVNEYKGEKYIFFNYESEISDLIIETGNTVALSAIDIAIKMNTKIIILAGQDLAFTENKYHAGEKTKQFSKYNYEKIIGNNNNKLYTNNGMKLFKKNIENLIRKNQHIKFFNTSKGAKIEGTEFIEYDKLEEKLK